MASEKLETENGVNKMGPQLLIDSEKYQGKYVALRSYTDNTVVAFGDKPEKVIDAAVEAGTEQPVIVYIPKHDMTYVY